MELYLLRHGIAEDGHAGMPDAERQLTAEGRKKLRVVLRAAARAGVKPTLILTSPLVRAVQTAEIASEELSHSGELVRCDSLKPEGNPRAVWDDVRAWRDEAQLLLASHNPLCDSLTGHLLGCPSLMTDFKKGALLRVDFEKVGLEPRGILRWFLVPRLTE